MATRIISKAPLKKNRMRNLYSAEAESITILNYKNYQFIKDGRVIATVVALLMSYALYAIQVTQFVLTVRTFQRNY